MIRRVLRWLQDRPARYAAPVLALLCVYALVAGFPEVALVCAIAVVLVIAGMWGPKAGGLF